MLLHGTAVAHLAAHHSHLQGHIGTMIMKMYDTHKSLVKD